MSLLTKVLAGGTILGGIGTVLSYLNDKKNDEAALEAGLGEIDLGDATTLLPTEEAAEAAADILNED